MGKGGRHHFCTAWEGKKREKGGEHLVVLSEKKDKLFTMLSSRRKGESGGEEGVIHKLLQRRGEGSSSGIG